MTLTLRVSNCNRQDGDVGKIVHDDLERKTINLGMAIGDGLDDLVLHDPQATHTLHV